MDRSTLERKSVDDLREIARQLDLSGTGRLRKAALIDTIIDASGNGDGGGDEDSDRSDVIERRRSRTRNRSNDGSDDTRDDADDDNDASDDDGGEHGDGDDEDGGDDAADAADDSDGDGRTRARSRDRRKRSRNRPSELDGLEEREGVLDLLPEGYGFLRTTGYVAGERDVYVSQSYVRRFNLRRGDLLGGPVRFNKGNDKFPALARLETCEGEVVDNEHDPILRERPDFVDLDVVFPEEQLVLGHGGSPVLRAVDAFAPLGRGQRALLLTPPAADAGALVRAVGAALAGRDDIDLFVALVDARPEEITECERTLDATDVVGSPLDAPAEDHVAAAELVVERAKRLAERGRDVVVLFDSLSQLGRAYNLAGSSSGRSLPGGLDTGAVAPLKQLFGSARNLDGEGSLTLLALTGLDPDSATDRTLLDHLRGAGNAELYFAPSLGTDGDLPALDVARSGTRRSGALLGEDAAAAVGEARSLLAQLDPGAAWALVAAHLAGDGDVHAVLEAARDALD